MSQSRSLDDLNEWLRTIPALAKGAWAGIYDFVDDIHYNLSYLLPSWETCFGNFIIWFSVWLLWAIFVILPVYNDPIVRFEYIFSISLRYSIVPLFDYGLNPLFHYTSWLLRLCRNLCVDVADWLVDPKTRPRRIRWMATDTDIYARHENLEKLYTEAIEKSREDQITIAYLRDHVEQLQNDRQISEDQLANTQANAAHMAVEVETLTTEIARMRAAEGQQVNIRIRRLQEDNAQLERELDSQQVYLHGTRTEAQKRLFQEAEEARKKSNEDSKQLQYANSQLQSLEKQRDRLQFENGDMRAEVKATRTVNDRLARQVARLTEGQKESMQMLRSLRSREWRYPLQLQNLAITGPRALPAPPEQEEQHLAAGPLVIVEDPDTVTEPAGVLTVIGGPEIEATSTGIEYNYSITDRHTLEQAWLRAFPKGYQIIRTSSTGREGGYRALMLSIQKQFSAGPGDIDFLKDLFAQCFPGVQGDNLTEVQLARIAFQLGRPFRHFVQMGVLHDEGLDERQFGLTLLRAEHHPAENYSTVWVHRSNREIDGHLYIVWSALEPPQPALEPPPQPAPAMIANRTKVPSRLQELGNAPTQGLADDDDPLQIVHNRWFTTAEDTSYLWLQNFSSLDAYHIIYTPSDQLRCGYHALLLSARSQLPDLPRIDVDTLQSLFFAYFPGEQAVNLTDVSLAHILYLWGQSLQPKRFLQLGIFQEEKCRSDGSGNSDALVVLRALCFPTENYQTLWIHHDNGESLGARFSHWSGLEPHLVHELPLVPRETQENGTHDSQDPPTAGDPAAHPEQVLSSNNATVLSELEHGGHPAVFIPATYDGIATGDTAAIPRVQLCAPTTSVVTHVPALPQEQTTAESEDTHMTETTVPDPPIEWMNIEPTVTTELPSSNPQNFLPQEVNIIPNIRFSNTVTPHDMTAQEVTVAHNQYRATTPETGIGEVNMTTSPPEFSCDLPPLMDSPTSGFARISSSNQNPSSRPSTFPVAQPVQEVPVQRRPPVPGLEDDSDTSTVSSARTDELGPPPTDSPPRNVFGQTPAPQPRANVSQNTQVSISRSPPTPAGGSFFQNSRGQQGAFTPQDEYDVPSEPLTGTVEVVYDGDGEETEIMEDDPNSGGADTRPGYDDEVEYGDDGRGNKNNQEGTGEHNYKDHELQGGEQDRNTIMGNSNNSSSSENTAAPYGPRLGGDINTQYPLPPIQAQTSLQGPQVIPSTSPPYMPSTFGTYSDPSHSHQRPFTAPGPIFVSALSGRGPRSTPATGPFDRPFPPRHPNMPSDASIAQISNPPPRPKTPEDSGEAADGRGRRMQIKESPPRCPVAEARERYDEMKKLKKQIKILEAYVNRADVKLADQGTQQSERTLQEGAVAYKMYKRFRYHLRLSKAVRKAEQDDEKNIIFSDPHLPNLRYELESELDMRVARKWSEVLAEQDAALRRNSHQMNIELGIHTKDTGTAPGTTPVVAPEDDGYRTVTDYATSEGSDCSEDEETWEEEESSEGKSWTETYAEEEANPKENLRKSDDSNVHEADDAATLHDDYTSSATRSSSIQDNQKDHPDIGNENAIAVPRTYSHDTKSTKRRRESDSDDDKMTRAPTRIRATPVSRRSIHLLSPHSHDRSDPPSSPPSTSQTIGPSIIYAASSSKARTQRPDPSISPLEAARYRLFIQRQAQSRYTYLTAYIERARKDWQSNDQDPELLAPIVAAEGLWTEEHDREVRMMQERTRLGDAATFLDLRLVEEPVVVVSEMKRRIRERVKKNKQGLEE